jgi:hypothetical protein
MHSSSSSAGLCIPLIRARWDKWYGGYVPNACVVNSTHVYVPKTSNELLAGMKR